MSVFNDNSVPQLDPERTLEIVLEALRELIEYELAVVLGLEDGGTLKVRKSAGPLGSERLADFSLSLAERRDLARIMEAGTPRLFGQDEEHIDTYDEILDLPSGHSCMVAPLSVDGRPIGLLTLDHRTCGMFTPGVVGFISTISRLISLSLAKADQAESLARVNAELVRERNALLSPGYEPIAGLVGASTAWLRAVEAIRLVAGSDLPVLLLGETGTGKELAAKAIHRLSGRAARSFVAVNCSALAPSLAESELFGHEKGSFTGAQAIRRGRFELADGGTLFLDEIGDLPPELQPKLLRALQEGSFERLGAEKPIRVDVRIVAATHVDLEEAVAAGRFRADLYYRLGAFPIRLPPLRERPGDTALLAERFVADVRQRPGMSAVGLSSGAIETLESRRWPGNVRELKNAVERGAILSRGGVIEEAHVADSAESGACAEEPRDRPAAARPAGDPIHGIRGARERIRPGNEPRRAASGLSTLADAQRDAILQALEASEGKIYGRGGAAELLGMKPSTLQSAMKRLGLERRAPSR